MQKDTKAKLAKIEFAENPHDMEDLLIAFEIAYRKNLGTVFFDRFITGLRADSEADVVNLAFRILNNLRCMSLNKEKDNG